MGFRVLAVPQSALAWLEERTGAVLTRQARGIAAVDAAGRIRGMVAYDNWTENSAQCHMATETPVAWRTLARPAFAYPFVQAGRGVLIGIIRARNTPSLRMATHLGFEVLQRLKDAGAVGEDLVVLQMRRQDCRWLKEAA